MYITKPCYSRHLLYILYLVRYNTNLRYSVDLLYNANTMKLPISDQILWGVFNFLKKVNDTYSSLAPRSLRNILSPEMAEIRRSIKLKRDVKYFSQIIYYLKRKGYIHIEQLSGKRGILLTKKGNERVLRIQQKLGLQPKRKDGKWQMIIFDIPEKKKKLRDILRSTLRALGYEYLQDSVWVCPYDVEKETEKFLQENSLDEYVRIFLIEEISL